MVRIALFLTALFGLPLLAAAGAHTPRALTGVAPGLWEVSRSARGENPRRLCLPDVAQLARIGHPGERCMATYLTDRPNLLVVDLTCGGGGDFARSRLSVTTPRSLKVETQGMHRGEPFDHVLYARRVGSCPRKAGRR